MDSRSTTIPQPVPPVAMFQGYDSITNAGRSTAVAGRSSNAGAVTQLYYQVCYDSSSLQDALNISGSAAASFGFGSASAKADYVDDLSVTNTSVSIVVYSNRIVASQTYTDVEPAVALPAADTLNGFFQAYGDSFVNQLVLGAEYMATYVFYSQSKSEQKKISEKLKACGITDGGTFSASLQTSLDQAQQSIDTRQTMQQLITGFTDLAAPASDEVVSFALAFSGLVPDAPTVVSFATLGYEHVPGMNEVMQPIVATRSLYETLSASYTALSQVHNQCRWLTTVYAAYLYGGDSSIKDNDALVAADIATLDKLFAQMDADPTSSYQAPPLPALALGAPVLQAAVTRGPAFGPSKGEPFDDVSESWVQNAVRIAGISLFGDNHITALEVTYESPYLATETVKHGEGSGHQSLPLSIPPGSFIVLLGCSANGSYLTFLSVAIQSEDDAHHDVLKWPANGGDDGKSYSWNGSTLGAMFIGFSGRAGKDLNQLAPVFATLSPAVWVPYAPGQDATLAAAE